MPSSRRPVPSVDSSHHHYDPLPLNHSAPPYEASPPARLSRQQNLVPSWNSAQPPVNSLAPPQFQHQPQPRLPLFEAALARSRGDPIIEAQQHFLSTQPLPSYVSPPDPNHPDLMIGFSQSNTVRFATNQDASHRGVSRSPSPSVIDTYEQQTNIDNDSQRLLSHNFDQQQQTMPNQMEWNTQTGDQYWDEKAAYGLASAYDEGDLSLPPFRGTDPNGPAIHIRGPTESTIANNKGDFGSAGLPPSSTQHFGPAPSGRVGRREHNAAGHRRIKHTATLDEHGFFAVDMPIPTRLAQFLPFKGVEEQKSTRQVHRYLASINADFIVTPL
jgi:chitin synthase